MAKTKVSKAKTKPKKGYDCNEVEAYLNRAINEVKQEILPRLKAVDERDKLQYDAAKKIMVDAHTVILARTEGVEKKADAVVREVEKMDRELHEIFESRKAMTQQLVDSFKSIEDKLDIHIADETQEFTQIRDGLTKAATHVEAIQNTLDNVSANGNKGLSNSLTDIYNKLHELQDVTQGARARAKFYTVLHDVVVTTPFLKPLKHKWGVIFYLAIFILLLNTVLHVFGVQWDLIGIFKWLLTLGLGKGN